MRMSLTITSTGRCSISATARDPLSTKTISQLVRMLRGEQSADEAMQSAADAWEQITAAAQPPALRSNYEQSLGL